MITRFIKPIVKASVLANPGITHQEYRRIFKSESSSISFDDEKFTVGTKALCVMGEVDDLFYTVQEVDVLAVNSFGNLILFRFLDFVGTALKIKSANRRVKHRGAQVACVNGCWLYDMDDLYGSHGDFYKAMGFDNFILST